MPPSARLSGADIRSFRAQRRFHGALLSIGVAPLARARSPKIAFIVSKKVSAKAAERNALKRALREAARPLLAGLPPLALVVTLKQGAALAPKQVVRAEFAGIIAEIQAVARE